MDRTKRPGKAFEVPGRRAESLLEGGIDECTAAAVQAATGQADERPVVAAGAKTGESAKAAPRHP
ncbi:MAG: hypothetical protein QNL14_17270, partial [Deltaproteobacteria bacterium]|nr:hypothetical protein [Deltaproteobacteria bacterium]